MVFVILLLVAAGSAISLASPKQQLIDTTPVLALETVNLTNQEIISSLEPLNMEDTVNNLKNEDFDVMLLEDIKKEENADIKLKKEDFDVIKPGHTKEDRLIHDRTSQLLKQNAKSPTSDGQVINQHTISLDIRRQGLAVFIYLRNQKRKSDNTTIKTESVKNNGKSNLMHRPKHIDKPLC